MAITWNTQPSSGSYDVGQLININASLNGLAGIATENFVNKPLPSLALEEAYFVDSNSTTLFVGGGSTNGVDAVVYSSTDNGDTFNTVYNDVSMDSVRAVDVNGQDVWTVNSSTTSSICKVYKNGVFKSQVDMGGTSSTTYSILVLSNGYIIIGGGNNNKFARSIDGGTTFELQVLLVGQAFCIEADGYHVKMTTINGRIYSSPNYGNTWGDDGLAGTSSNVVIFDGTLWILYNKSANAWYTATKDSSSFSAMANPPIFGPFCRIRHLGNGNLIFGEHNGNRVAIRQDGVWSYHEVTTDSIERVYDANLINGCIFAVTGTSTGDGKLYRKILSTDFKLYKLPYTLIDSQTKSDGAYSFSNTSDITDIGGYYLTATNSGTTIASNQFTIGVTGTGISYSSTPTIITNKKYDHSVFTTIQEPISSKSPVYSLSTLVPITVRARTIPSFGRTLGTINFNTERDVNTQYCDPLANSGIANNTAILFQQYLSSSSNNENDYIYSNNLPISYTNLIFSCDIFVISHVTGARHYMYSHMKTSNSIGYGLYVLNGTLYFEYFNSSRVLVTIPIHAYSNVAMNGGDIIFKMTIDGDTNVVFKIGETYQKIPNVVLTIDPYINDEYTCRFGVFCDENLQNYSKQYWYDSFNFYCDVYSFVKKDSGNGQLYHDLPITIRWYKSGVLIPRLNDSSKIYFSRDYDTDQYVSGAMFGDAGSYSVVVDNFEGTATQNFTIAVSHPVMSLQTYTQNYKFKGRNFVFGILWQLNWGAVSFKVYKDGTEITDPKIKMNRVSIGTNYDNGSCFVNIENFSASHFGNYLFEVTDSVRVVSTTLVLNSFNSAVMAITGQSSNIAVDLTSSDIRYITQYIRPYFINPNLSATVHQSLIGLNRSSRHDNVFNGTGGYEVPVKITTADTNADLYIQFNFKVSAIRGAKGVIITNFNQLTYNGFLIGYSNEGIFLRIGTELFETLLYDFSADSFLADDIENTLSIRIQPDGQVKVSNLLYGSNYYVSGGVTTCISDRNITIGSDLSNAFQYRGEISKLIVFSSTNRFMVDNRTVYHVPDFKYNVLKNSVSVVHDQLLHSYAIAPVSGINGNYNFDMVSESTGGHFATGLINVSEAYETLVANDLIDFTATVGQSKSFNVVLRVHTGEVTYEWYKGTVDDANKIGNTTSTLSFNQITLNDHAMYSVVVKDVKTQIILIGFAKVSTMRVASNNKFFYVDYPSVKTTEVSLTFDSGVSNAIGTVTYKWKEINRLENITHVVSTSPTYTRSFPNAEDVNKTCIFCEVTDNNVTLVTGKMQGRVILNIISTYCNHTVSQYYDKTRISIVGLDHNIDIDKPSVISFEINWFLNGVKLNEFWNHPYINVSQVGTYSFTVQSGDGIFRSEQISITSVIGRGYRLGGVSHSTKPTNGSIVWQPYSDVSRSVKQKTITINSTEVTSSTAFYILRDDIPMATWESMAENIVSISDVYVTTDVFGNNRIDSSCQMLDYTMNYISIICFAPLKVGENHFYVQFKKSVGLTTTITNNNEIMLKRIIQNNWGFLFTTPTYVDEFGRNASVASYGNVSWDDIISTIQNYPIARINSPITLHEKFDGFTRDIGIRLMGKSGYSTFIYSQQYAKSEYKCVGLNAIGGISEHMTSFGNLITENKLNRFAMYYQGSHRTNTQLLAPFTGDFTFRFVFGGHRLSGGTIGTFKILTTILTGQIENAIDVTSNSYPDPFTELVYPTDDSGVTMINGISTEVTRMSQTFSPLVISIASSEMSVVITNTTGESAYYYNQLNTQTYSYEAVTMSYDSTLKKLRLRVGNKLDGTYDVDLTAWTFMFMGATIQNAQTADNWMMMTGDKIFMKRRYSENEFNILHESGYRI